MAVSKMLGHASYVTTLTVYADYITECDGGKAAPLGRPVASTAAERGPNASAAGGLAPGRACQSSFSMRAMHVLAQFICRTELL